MEHPSTSLVKQRSRYTRRQRSLDLPKICHTSRKRKKTGEREEIWIVDGRDHAGERYRLVCHSKAVAEAKAQEQLELRKQHFRLGMNLPIAVIVEALEAYQKGISIREAVAFFEKNRPKTEPVLVRFATEAYVYDREKIKKCGKGVDQMKNMFKRINAKFGDRLLHELNTQEIQDWLLLQQKAEGWKDFARIGDERRNTILKLFRALFTFASSKARGWVAPDHNPAKDVPFITIHRQEPCTMSPDETAQFLRWIPTFPKDVQAYAVLRVFAPIRRCEFEGLDWLKLKDRILRVLGKGRKRRPIQLERVCMAWLRPLIKTSGPILERTLPNADEYLRAAFIKIGLRAEAAEDTDDLNPTKNILRHSSCTYLHLVYGAATAARWAGHSEKIQAEHYIGLRDEAEAKKWIALTPKLVAKRADRKKLRIASNNIQKASIAKNVGTDRKD